MKNEKIRIKKRKIRGKIALSASVNTLMLAKTLHVPVTDSDTIYPYASPTPPIIGVNCLLIPKPLTCAA